LQRINIADTRLSEQEIAAAVAVLRSGMLRQGKVCEAFESAFARHEGARHACASSSGTAALHLAYLTFLQPGQEVLVPSFTFFATASAVNLSGGTPVFCDVDPQTFLIDLADAERRITERTRAICPVHLFGNACDLDAVQDFARKHRLTVVWDAAQAHGARFKGRGMGDCDGPVCYSFYPTKNLFVGEGGMTLTRDEETLTLLQSLRSHGESERYLHTRIGFNYRMTDIEAAIGNAQLDRLDAMLATRRRNAALLRERLGNVPGLRLQAITPGSEHAWHQFCVLMDAAAFGCDRDALAARLNAAGIGTGIHYPRGLHQQPVYEQLYGRMRLPVTEELAAHILALPVHHGLGLPEVERIAEAVQAARG
jgi:dTDP-4-amino-4,6-dideoxygalactose transaminase